MAGKIKDNDVAERIPKVGKGRHETLAQHRPDEGIDNIKHGNDRKPIKGFPF